MIRVVCALIYSDAGLLLTQRKDNGKWEFPGGKLRTNETINSGIVREIKEELGISVSSGAIIGEIECQDYQLIFIECQYKNPQCSISLNDHMDLKWINSRSQIQGIDQVLLEGDRLFVERFIEKLKFKK
jgi:8-oxo-dGTP diphosphatase